MGSCFGCPILRFKLRRDMAAGQDADLHLDTILEGQQLAIERARSRVEEVDKQIQAAESKARAISLASPKMDTLQTGQMKRLFEELAMLKKKRKRLNGALYQLETVEETVQNTKFANANMVTTAGTITVVDTLNKRLKHKKAGGLDPERADDVVATAQELHQTATDTQAHLNSAFTIESEDSDDTTDEFKQWLNEVTLDSVLRQADPPNGAILKLAPDAPLRAMPHDEDDGDAPVARMTARMRDELREIS
jgi:hypothetical protein